MNPDTHAAESVTEGHPDKVCDYIADAVLDRCLDRDRADGTPGRSRVACEVLFKGRLVVVAGEVTSPAEVDAASVVRSALEEIGYDEASLDADPAELEILPRLTRQAGEIARGVDRGTDPEETGAGDQGIMFGYATDETPELMPLPILLAHRLTRTLAADRKAGRVGWLRPDGKSQVAVAYRDGRPDRATRVLVSTQHAPSVPQERIAAYVREDLAPRALGDWHRPDIRFQVNPTGSFEEGGPAVDCGLTGRKIVVDTYGGACPAGGGALSGKDPTKVDRSAAYFCRFVARRLVEEGLARRAQVRVGYAIGEAEPFFTGLETFGTGDPEAARAFLTQFDFRPGPIAERLGLWTDIRYRDTTNYGHFGRPGLPWEGLGERIEAASE